MEPSVEPCTASAPSAALMGSDSNHSSVNSTADIDRLRMTRNMSFEPRRRSRHASAASGRPCSIIAALVRRGIGVPWATSRNDAAVFMNCTNSGQRAASRSDSRRIESSVAASRTSAESLSRPPSGSGAMQAGAGPLSAECNPCCARLRSRTMSSRSLPPACKRVDVEVLAVCDRCQLAAGFRAALEHEHLAAGLRQVGGCHQSVVACADDDDVGVRHAGS